MIAHITYPNILRYSCTAKYYAAEWQLLIDAYCCK
jgi:hypothetical protein